MYTASVVADATYVAAVSSQNLQAKTLPVRFTHINAIAWGQYIVLATSSTTLFPWRNQPVVHHAFSNMTKTIPFCILRSLCSSSFD